MSRPVFVVVAIPLTFTHVVAQEPAGPFERHAWELREKLTCPRDVVWPPLPETGQRVFGAVEFVGAHQRPVITARGQTPPDPAVDVPQYAYFLDPDVEVCHPAVILQSGELALGYRLIGTDRVAASWRPFFILLGPEPPAGAGSGIRGPATGSPLRTPSAALR